MKPVAEVQMLVIFFAPQGVICCCPERRALERELNLTECTEFQGLPKVEKGATPPPSDLINLEVQGSLQ